MDISRHISNLLYRHDCVIIPGFGGFVCNPVPAKIHKSNGVITPPTKSIAFNRQLQTNDGLLINEIAEKEGITFELASQRVKRSIAVYEEKIKNKDWLYFTKVGKLYTDPHGNLQFLPDYAVNYLLEAYGLGMVKALPLEGAIPVSIPGGEQRVIPAVKKVNLRNTPSARKKRKSNRFIGAFTTLGILMLLFSVFQFTTQNSEIYDMSNVKTGSFRHKLQTNYADVSTYITDLLFDNDEKEFLKEEWERIADAEAGEKPDTVNVNPDTPVTNEPAASIAETPPPVIAEPEIVETKKIEPEPVPEKKITPVIVKPKAEKPVKPAPVVPAKPKNTGTYSVAIVVGAFKDQHNAEKLQKQLLNKSYESTITTMSNGYFRVAIGFETKSAAQEELSKVRSEISEGAWILKN